MAEDGILKYLPELSIGVTYFFAVLIPSIVQMVKENERIQGMEDRERERFRETKELKDAYETEDQYIESRNLTSISLWVIMATKGVAPIFVLSIFNTPVWPPMDWDALGFVISAGILVLVIIHRDKRCHNSGYRGVVYGTWIAVLLFVIYLQRIRENVDEGQNEELKKNEALCTKEESKSPLFKILESPTTTLPKEI